MVYFRESIEKIRGEGLMEMGLGKLKLLCEATWVERHTTLEEFREIYEAFLDCLTATSNNEGNRWSFKTTDAFGRLCAISMSAFIAAFHV